MINHFFRTRSWISKITGSITIFAMLVGFIPALLLPTPVSAATLAGFPDSFGTDNTANDITGWKESEHPNDNGTDVVAKQSSESSSNSDYKSPNGGRFAKVVGDNDEWFCKLVDATGYQSLILSYYWRGEASAEPEDFGVVEIGSDGISESTCNSNAQGAWAVLASHALDDTSGESNQTQEAWAPNSVNLPADNDGKFLLRFRNSSSADAEYFRVDGVAIEGTATPTKGSSVTKTTVGGDGTFNMTGTGSIGAFALSTTAGTASQTFTNLTPGSFTITETVPAGWTKTGDTCTNVTVVAGQTATCTITNTKDATLTLTKEVINDDGGTAVANDFQAKIDGNNVPWGIAQVVSFITHIVSEVNIPGYTAGVWGGDCAADGSVTLAAGQNKTCTVTNNDTPSQEPVSGKVHIYKFIDGQQATAQSANNASFPMITPTYGNAPFTLDADGWTEGDAPYEASTSTIQGGGTYTAYENTETALVGASCEDGKPFALVGYSTGTSLEGAMESEKSESAPTVTVDGDQVIIVWNESCEGGENPTTIKVHIYKYLKDGDAIQQVSDESDAPQFPMTASWNAVNIGEGTGEYVLGNNHGGAAFTYAADTSAMQVPADYSTSEITSEEGDVFPLGSEFCPEGSYRLLGYKTSQTSLEDAEASGLVTSTPTFNDLTSDAYVIVVNEECGAAVPDQCIANEPAVYVSEEGDGMVPVTPHPAWTSLEGATWVYSEALNEQGSPPTGDVTFTRTFTINDTPKDSTLEIAADNMYTVSINGTTLDTGTSAVDLENFGSVDTWTIPAAMLLPGENTLEITVTNPGSHPETEVPFGDPNPGGLLYKLTIQSDDCPEGGSEDGTIVIEKQIKGAGDGIFSFENNLTDGTFSITTVEGSGSETFSDLAPGTYSVSEIVPEGWELIGASCSDESNPSEIDLAEGETITCTFTNIQEETEAQPPQCSDGVDHDGDLDIDANDSRCHTDGDGSNESSYDPNDDDESAASDESENQSGSVPTASSGSVLGAFTGPAVLGETACTEYVTDYIRWGAKNDSANVMRLQTFLNKYLGLNLTVNGIYDLPTFNAVKQFQLKEADQVLAPWVGVTMKDKIATGWVYKTTRRWINMLNCPDLNIPQFTRARLF